MVVLDTDIFIDFFRKVKKSSNFIFKHKDEIIFSSITEGELLSGKVCNNTKEREKLLHFLAQFEKIPIDNPLIQIAGDIRRVYGINLDDCIIAATAIHTDSILITRNVKDFKKIKKLKIDKPY